MSAPRSKELDERHSGLGLLLKVVLIQLHHLRGVSFLSIICGSCVRLVLVKFDKVCQVINVPGTRTSFVLLNLPSIPEILTIISSRYSSHLETLEVGQGRIALDIILVTDQLCDLHFGLGLELLGQLVPDRSQLLTVSTKLEWISNKKFFYR